MYGYFPADVQVFLANLDKMPVVFSCFLGKRLFFYRRDGRVLEATRIIIAKKTEPVGPALRETQIRGHS